MDTRQINCIILAGSAIATSGHLHESPEENEMLERDDSLKKEKILFVFEFGRVIEYLSSLLTLIFALMLSFEFCGEKIDFLSFQLLLFN